MWSWWAYIVQLWVLFSYTDVLFPTDNTDISEVAFMCSTTPFSRSEIQYSNYLTEYFTNLTIKTFYID